MPAEPATLVEGPVTRPPPAKALTAKAQEPDLEELFLTFYRGEESANAA